MDPQRVQEEKQREKKRLVKIYALLRLKCNFNSVRDHRHIQFKSATDCCQIRRPMAAYSRVSALHRLGSLRYDS